VGSEQKAFGDFLKILIKSAKMTHAEFYDKIGITKPYFYDILSGRVNPPPSDMQYKAVKILDSDEKERTAFFDLAANGRNELPADIVSTISEYPEIKSIMRNHLNQLLAISGGSHKYEREA